LDGGDARAECEAASRERGFLRLGFVHRGDLGVEGPRSFFNVKSRVRVARFALLARDARQRRGVHDHCVSANARNDDRPVARNAVELRARGEAPLGELVLVEPVPAKPAFRAPRGELRQPAEDVVDAGAPDEVDFADDLLAEPQQVDVRVAEPGRDGAAGEGDAVCLRTGER
jgi:hypothetical protein